MYVSGSFAIEIISKKSRLLIMSLFILAVVYEVKVLIYVCGNQVQSGLGLSLFKVTQTPL